MRIAGVLILVAGLLMTLTTGFTIFTKEKVVDLGTVELMHDDSHTFAWPAYVGLGVMVVGGVLLLSGWKKRTTS